MSFNTWCRFKAVFPKETLDNHHAYIHAREASVPRELDTILKPISALSFDALTFLDISGCYLDAVALNNLLPIPNLGALALDHFCLGNEFCREEDWRLLSNWCRAVEESRAFQKLRVLVLRNIHLRTRILYDFARFPALTLLDGYRWCDGFDHGPDD